MSVLRTTGLPDLQARLQRAVDSSAASVERSARLIEASHALLAGRGGQAAARPRVPVR